MKAIAFSASDLVEQLDRLVDYQLDEVTFGVVRMDLNGIVLTYNQAESLISGVEPSQAIGKHFFTQIAPCTDNFMVSFRYTEAILDEEINYIFTKVTTPTKVRLRMLRTVTSQFQYLLVKRI